MSAAPTKPGGWLESLRSIGGSLWTLLRSRFELFAVEWQEEKLRVLNLLIWLGLAVFVGAAGFFIAMIALALWLWRTTGYAGLVGLAVINLGVAFAILRAIRRKIRTGPPPFAQTIAEFRKDSECLRNVN